MDLVVLGQNAVKSKYAMQTLTTEVKNAALVAIAKALVEHTDEILLANEVDIKYGEAA